MGTTGIEAYSYTVHFYIYINIQSKCNKILSNDFGKYPRQVISCTHNKIAQFDINSDINHHHL